jgi:hypothetical protein
MVDVVQLAGGVDDACSFCALVDGEMGGRVQPLGGLNDNIDIMMMRHRRWPAIVVLVLVVGVGALYVGSWGRGAGGDGASIAELEKQISRGKVDAATWNAYGGKLVEAKRFEDAATAYKKVLELEPANRSAKTGCAISLAKAKNEEEFYKFMSDLVASDAKMAMDIFDRGECQAWLGQARFATLKNNARAEAMD